MLCITHILEPGLLSNVPAAMDIGIICALTAAPSSEPVQVSMFCRHKNVNIALLMMPVKHHNVQTTRACESVNIEQHFHL